MKRQGKTFAIVRKGYDCEAVDAYLGQQAAGLRGTQDTLKARVEQLEQDKTALRKELDAYRAKEQAIADAMLGAQEVLSQAKEQARLLADAESNRLHAFSLRWTTYAKQALAEECPALCETLASMQAEYAANVAKALQQNLFCAPDALYPEYLAEQARVKGTSSHAVHIEELLDKLRS